MSSMAVSSSGMRASRVVDWGRFALVGLATIVAALIANVIVYNIGSVLVGYNPQFVVLATVWGTIIFTIVPAVVAVLLYAVLAALYRRLRRESSRSSPR